MTEPTYRSLQENQESKKRPIGRPAKKIKVELTEREEVEIERLARSESKDVRIKAQLLLLLSSGEYTQPELIKMTGKSRQQILNFISRFRKYGMEAIKRKYIFNKQPIRQVKIQDDQIEDLLRVAPQKPRDLNLDFDSWTLKRLVSYIYDKYGINLTRERIRQILEKHKISYYTTRKMPSL